jgi:cytochrome c-type biogenesis protein
MELGIATAFIAGVVSFVSPCVLPLVPGYLAMITGMSVEELQEEERKCINWPVLLNALLFVLGFSLLFVALGASAGVVGQFLAAHRMLLNRVAGVGIVFFGLVLLGWVPIAALSRDARYQGAIKKGRLTAFLLGLAFAFGWTPCVGPALAAMLMMASTQETVARGTALLGVYSAGMGLPFLLVALGVGNFLSLYRRWRSRLVWVERFAGVLLLAVGVLVFFNYLQELAAYLTWFNRFAW